MLLKGRTAAMSGGASLRGSGRATAMARELGPGGIRVNCVAPGLIQADITGAVIAVNGGMLIH